MTTSTGKLHTASGEWLSNVFLALAKFAIRRPKTRWVLSVAMRPGAPYFIILLCLTPDYFTRQGEYCHSMG
jgi:hypothetical protein